MNSYDRDKLYKQVWEMPVDLRTMESLFAKHSSKPFNPKLAHVFFVSGMIAGLGAAAQLIRWLPEDIAEHRILVTAAIAVIVGILAVKCLDPLVTVSTAAIGAALVGIPCTYMVMNLTDLTKNISTEPFDTMRNLNRAMFDDFMTQQTMIITAVTGILFIIGMVAQFRTNDSVRR